MSRKSDYGVGIKQGEYGARVSFATAMVAALAPAELRALTESVRNEARRRRLAFKAARALFKAVHPNDAGRARCEWIALPGRHASVEVCGRHAIARYRVDLLNEGWVYDDRTDQLAKVVRGGVEIEKVKRSSPVRAVGAARVA